MALTLHVRVPLGAFLLALALPSSEAFASCCSTGRSRSLFAASISSTHHRSPVKPVLARELVPSPLRMVRNIDFPEALIFYDTISDDTSSSNDAGSSSLSVLLEDDGSTPRAGLLDLLQECREVNTPALLITQQPTNPTYSKELLDYLQVVEELSPGAPNPKSLWESIQALTIQPAGFGGSAGFGRKLADPERSPMPQHVVVFCSSLKVCQAARYVGMRVLCLQDNDLADAIIDDYYNLYLEDVATPGSFWLNPPYPRDEEGNKVHIFDMMQDDGDNNDNNSDDDGNDKESAMSEKDRLRAILDDMDPL